VCASDTTLPKSSLVQTGAPRPIIHFDLPAANLESKVRAFRPRLGTKIDGNDPVQIRAELVNPSFEEPYAQVTSLSGGVSGSIAHGWSDYSSGDVNGTYQEGTVASHSGSSYQTAQVRSVSSNSIFQIGQSVPTLGFAVYNIGLWVKGEPGCQIVLSVFSRQNDDNLDSIIPITLSRRWTFYSVPVHTIHAGALGVIISATDPVTFSIDDVSLDGMNVPWLRTSMHATYPTGLGVHFDNYLVSTGPYNLDFEAPFVTVASPVATITGRIATYWHDGSWQDNRKSSEPSISVEYSRNTNTPHGGAADQIVKINSAISGGWQMMQRVNLSNGMTYRASIWIKGTPQMGVYFQLCSSASPTNKAAFASIATNGQWQQIVIGGSPTYNGWSYLLIGSATVGTIELDDASVSDSSANISFPKAWPDYGLSSWRLWDEGTTWAAVEPNRGEWDFTLLDRAVSDAMKHDVPVIITLGQTPDWESSAPKNYSPYGMGAAGTPTSLNDWRAYVNQVASRYKGQVIYYELWDEPNSPAFFQGSVANLLTLASAAHEELKNVDPNIILIGPTVTTQIGYLKDFLHKGGGSYVDAIGYHIYDHEDAPERDAAIIADIQSILQETGNASKGIWLTETAVGADTADDTKSQALIVRKLIVDQMFLGSSGRLNWYRLGPATPFCLGTEQADGSQSIAGAALSTFQKWIDGAQNLFLSLDPQGNWVLRFQSKGGKLKFIVWNPSQSSNWPSISPKAGLTVQSLNGTSQEVTGGARVSDSPILVEIADGRFALPLLRE